MRPLGPALALLVAALALPQASQAGSDPLVACSLHGELVLQRRADCLRAGGRPAAAEERTTSRLGSALDGGAAEGATERSVFACRTPQALASVTSMAPGARWMLAQALVRAGDCTRIERDTRFAVVERRAGALRVRMPTLGSFWVSEWVEVPNLDRLELPSASPEPPPKPQPAPSAKEPTPGAGSDDGHARTCNCGGEVRITAQRDCREACGVSFRTAVHDACDRAGCYWHGERMSRKEMQEHAAHAEGME